MTKVKLLNDGDFGGMDDVQFPVVVEAEYIKMSYVKVNGAELNNIDGVGSLEFDVDYDYTFFIGEECEVIEEEE